MMINKSCIFFVVGVEHNTKMNTFSRMHSGTYKPVLVAVAGFHIDCLHGWS